MSEFNPFSAAEEAPEYLPEQSEESASSRKPVVLVGALAAVLVGAGAFLFLGGGGDDTEEFTAVAKAPRAAAPAASVATGPVVKLPVSSKLTLGRNPFRALYVEPVAAPAPAGGVTKPTSTGVTAPTVVVAPAPVTGGQPAPAQPVPFQPAPAQPAQPAPAPAQSTVALKGVAAAKDGSNPTATFVYDGQEVSGAPGDVMAGKLLVISIQQDNTGGWFANLQLGDGSPFEVHERQTVLVQ